MPYHQVRPAFCDARPHLRGAGLRVTKSIPVHNNRVFQCYDARPAARASVTVAAERAAVASSRTKDPFERFKDFLFSIA